MMAVPIDGGVKSKPHVVRTAEFIQQRWGITNIGGSATSGHVANSDHYKGLALDVMLTGAGPWQGKKLLGDRIAEWAIAQPSVTYVIWNRRIFDRRNERGWESYNLNPHTTHVHISFGEEGSDITGEATWNPLGAFVNAIVSFFQSTGLRIAAFVGGIVILLIGIVMWRNSR